MLTNKYSEWYYKIIDRAKGRTLDGYVEHHHIIPRCIGGSDDPENIVRLTAREHYICHWLLTKMASTKNEHHKLSCAFFYTLHGTKLQNKQFTARQYEVAKRTMSKAKRGASVNYNYNSYLNGPLSKWNGSEEQKKFLRESLKNRKITWGAEISKSRIGKRYLIKEGKSKVAMPGSEKWDMLIADGWTPKVNP